MNTRSRTIRRLEMIRLKCRDKTFRSRGVKSNSHWLRRYNRVCLLLGTPYGDMQRYFYQEYAGTRKEPPVMSQLTTY